MFVFIIFKPKSSTTGVDFHFFSSKWSDFIYVHEIIGRKSTPFIATRLKIRSILVITLHSPKEMLHESCDAIDARDHQRKKFSDIFSQDKVLRSESSPLIDISSSDRSEIIENDVDSYDWSLEWSVFIDRMDKLRRSSSAWMDVCVHLSSKLFEHNVLCAHLRLKRTTSCFNTFKFCSKMVIDSGWDGVLFLSSTVFDDKGGVIDLKDMIKSEQCGSCSSKLGASWAWSHRLRSQSVENSGDIDRLWPKTNEPIEWFHRRWLFVAAWSDRDRKFRMQDSASFAWSNHLYSQRIARVDWSDLRWM